MGDEPLLAHRYRQDIIRAILADPGMTFDRLRVDSFNGRRSLRYHLNRLVDAGFVRSVRANGLTRHYVEPAGAQAVDQLALLESPTAVLILRASSRRPWGTSLEELARAVDAKPLATKVWAYRLAKCGLARVERGLGLNLRCTPEGRRLLAWSKNLGSPMHVARLQSSI